MAPAMAAQSPVVANLPMAISWKGPECGSKVILLASGRGDGSGRRSDASRALAAPVAARNAGVEAGQDLVGDGAGSPGHLLHRDRLVAVGPDQHDLVLVPRAVAPDIDHELVHADASCHPMAAAMDEDLAAGGQRTRPAVAIPDGYGHHACVGRWRPGGPVADRVACADDLEVHHLRNQ